MVLTKLHQVLCIQGGAAWKAALEGELAKLHDGAILVGHSIGATIVISALREGSPAPALRGIFLIATPYVGKGGWPSEDIEPMSGIGAKLPAQGHIRRLP